MKKYLDYLPEFLRKYKEIQAISDVEDTVMQDEEEYIKSCMSMPWVSTADENGIKRYEKMFNISCNENDSLDIRKKAIKIYLNRSFIYTYKNFDEYLKSICQEDGYELNVINSEYTVKIKLALSAASLYDTVCENARKMIPANMIVDIEIMYNQHEYVSQHTHEELLVYTHKNIREKNMTS